MHQNSPWQYSRCQYSVWPEQSPSFHKLVSVDPTEGEVASSLRRMCQSDGEEEVNK